MCDASSGVGCGVIGSLLWGPREGPQVGWESLPMIIDSGYPATIQHLVLALMLYQGFHTFT